MVIDDGTIRLRLPTSRRERRFCRRGRGNGSLVRARRSTLDDGACHPLDGGLAYGWAGAWLGDRDSGNGALIGGVELRRLGDRDVNLSRTGSPPRGVVAGLPHVPLCSRSSMRLHMHASRAFLTVLEGNAASLGVAYPLPERVGTKPSDAGQTFEVSSSSRLLRNSRRTSAHRCASPRAAITRPLVSPSSVVERSSSPWLLRHSSLPGKEHLSCRLSRFRAGLLGARLRRTSSAPKSE